MDKRMTYGGNGSHWDGCTDVHWDCKIAKLEADNARLTKRIYELEFRYDSLCTCEDDPREEGMLSVDEMCPIHGNPRGKVARLTAELAELNDKAVFIQFENEDELPSDIQDDVYSAMFNCSHVDGVRLFPYIEENGQKYFLVMLKEEECQNTSR